MNSFIYLAPVAGVIALIFAFYKAMTINKSEAGNDRMKEIASAIAEGARAFLFAEYKVLVIFVAVLFIVLGFGISWLTAVCFLVGALFSTLAGYFGMTVATKANVRTANAAKESGMNKALSIAFSGGAVMGLSVVGLGIIGISVIFIILNATGEVTTDAVSILTGFSLGASSIALFARVGGGIYTKAADVGADLVGKVEAGIPEDDPRNPAVIADNVGDNVGDVAGMGADLFESYVGALVSAVTLGIVTTLGDATSFMTALFPLVIAAIGILASVIATFFVRGKEGSDPQKALNAGEYTATVLVIIASAILSKVFFGGFDAFIAIISGLIVGTIIGKVTEMYTSINGELCKIDKAYSGEIVILQNEFLKLNSVLGDTKLLPQRKKIENPHPLLQTTVEPSKPEQREMLLDALLEISDSDPLLRYYVDSTTHEIILSFLGKVQMEVISALLQEKYHVEIEIKEPTVIYMERPLKKAEYTIHIEVPPNPFWASIGLSVAQLPLGSGVQYESSVSLGYLNQSFQNAVMEGIRYGCEQGLYGWNVTDCKICFKYGLYYSPVSTPADFRMLAPIVLEQVLKKAGTELLEPYLSFKIYAPQEYLSRAYNDAPKYCANIVDTQLKNNEVILSGEIPARCIQEYRSDLTFFTNGRSVCLTELKGYHVTTGEPVCQPRRPNSRIDKVRYMFNKIT